MDRNAPIQELNGVGPKLKKYCKNLEYIPLGIYSLLFQGIISRCRSRSISVWQSRRKSMLSCTAVFFSGNKKYQSHADIYCTV